MTTELEQARAHLRYCQHDLNIARGIRDRREPKGPKERMSERLVLAALSWVWDAQERRRTGNFMDAMGRYVDGACTINEARAELGLPPLEDLMETVTVKVTDPADVDRIMGVEGALNVGFRQR